MAYNRAKLIVDIYQVFIKIINQQLQGMIGKPKPSNAQLNIANAMSTDLGTAIHNYVLNGEFVLSNLQTITIASDQNLKWLYSTDGTKWSINTTQPTQNWPGATNTVIPAVNYMRTISIASAGNGNLDAKIFMKNAELPWAISSRSQMYNSAFALIPPGAEYAVSLQNTGGGNTDVFITDLRAGKTS